MSCLPGPASAPVRYKEYHANIRHPHRRGRPDRVGGRDRGGSPRLFGSHCRREGPSFDLLEALVVHARTLEMFENMGVAPAIRAAGVPFSALNVSPVIGKPAIRIDLMGLEWGDTRYPYWLSIPQYETERCLEEYLATQGVAVAWQVRFESLVTAADHVEAG
jgi:2-polyprenyl-6-methoxyphenol hydroxylase-like FAD-dependent oxidoreductase